MGSTALQFCQCKSIHHGKPSVCHHQEKALNGPFHHWSQWELQRDLEHAFHPRPPWASGALANQTRNFSVQQLHQWISIVYIKVISSYYHGLIFDVWQLKVGKGGCLQSAHVSDCGKKEAEGGGRREKLGCICSCVNLFATSRIVRSVRNPLFVITRSIVNKQEECQNACFPVCTRWCQHTVNRSLQHDYNFLVNTIQKYG